jgi:hypothetical protein
MPQRYVTAVHAAIQKAITEPDIRELYADKLGSINLASHSPR